MDIIRADGPSGYLDSYAPKRYTIECSIQAGSLHGKPFIYNKIITSTLAASYQSAQMISYITKAAFF
jgi:hypothetical protein